MRKGESLGFVFLLASACGGAPFSIAELPDGGSRETAVLSHPDDSPPEASPLDAPPPPPLRDAFGGETSGGDAGHEDAGHIALPCPSGGGGPFAVVPSVASFGDVRVGYQASLDLEIVNNGDCLATLTLAGGGLSSPFAASSPCVGDWLWPGASCAFTVVFTPDKLGPVAATSMLTVNRENFAISATGNGVP